uniref:Protein TIC 20 n=1 Tax=Hemiselmis andersenii TaxID=464988 RepID=A0A6U2G7E7_HEMAN|mmetsp:Transcript_35509/g.83149  ORF Transcript_35509/g.83149 Transcript_35509/m.83149 type:complete len:224 (+) Transcript_35509:226-897(+)
MPGQRSLSAVLAASCIACSVMTASAFSPAALGSLPLKSSAFSASASAPLPPPRRAAGGGLVGMRMQEEGITPVQRLTACLPYVLPLADGFEWGRYVFEQVPIMALPFVPLFPIMGILNLPFVSFGIFIFLFSFVARNPEIPRFVRFNTLQAIYIDIALIFPQLFKSLMGATGGLPAEIGVPLTNFVFYCMAASVSYCVIKNAIGETPNELPLISESVDNQMPF